ncbi:hypothetical protein D3C72_1958410 [compost metagenome]
MQIERPDLFSHEVNKNADARGQVLAAEVTDVMPAVVRRIPSHGDDQFAAGDAVAGLVARHLRDAQPVEHRRQHQLRVIERQPCGRHNLAHMPLDLEFPFKDARAGDAGVDAFVPGEILQRRR